LLRRQGLPEDLDIQALPELGRPGEARVSPPEVLSDSPAAGRPAPACTRSRMLVRRGDGIAYLPCPLVDDDPTMELGSQLDVALANAVQPRHARCKICHTHGVDYAGVP
jgi:hypothetical protein